MITDTLPRIADEQATQEVSVMLQLPGLNTVHDALMSYGQGVESSVPLNNGHVQVGFRGKPQGFGRVGISQDETGLHVQFDEPRPIEGPYIETLFGKKRVARGVIGPIASIDLVDSGSEKGWGARLRDADGKDVLVDEGHRVLLARTVAKLADVTLRKL